MNPRSNGTRSFWITIAVAVGIGSLALAWTMLDAQTIRSAPDFTLTGYDGTVYHYADLRGKVIVLNFWASWCGPCRAEASGLQQTWRDLQDRDVIFLGVAQGDTPEHARAYLDEYHITYPNGPDTGLVQAFGVQGLPTTIVIDRKGNISATMLAGVEPSDLRARIEAALRQE